MKKTKTKTKTIYSDKWGTPMEWFKWVRETLGTDYFDPCPATWAGGPDGLTIPWPTDRGVYVNHPGGRGRFISWFSKFMAHNGPKVWCGFNLSQIRLSCVSGWLLFDAPGYLVIPHKRVPYVWLGPDTPTRSHGEAQKSPTQDSFFWSSVEPAEPPVDCTIVRTGEWSILCHGSVKGWVYI